MSTKIVPTTIESLAIMMQERFQALDDRIDRLEKKMDEGAKEHRDFESRISRLEQMEGSVVSYRQMICWVLGGIAVSEAFIFGLLNLVPKLGG